MQRITRHIFHSLGTIATSTLVLRPGELRRTALSVPLPRVLPPTFSGTSLRFSYHVQVSWTADFQTSEVLLASASHSAAMDAPVDTPPDALSAPSEPSASQVQSHHNSPMGKLAMAQAQAGVAATGAAPIISAADIAQSMRVSDEAKANGKAASAAGTEGEATATNGQVCGPRARPCDTACCLCSGCTISQVMRPTCTLRPSPCIQHPAPNAHVLPVVVRGAATSWWAGWTRLTSLQPKFSRVPASRTGIRVLGCAFDFDSR